MCNWFNRYTTELVGYGNCITTCGGRNVDGGSGIASGPHIGHEGTGIEVRIVTVTNFFVIQFGGNSFVDDRAVGNSTAIAIGDGKAVSACAEA